MYFYIKKQSKYGIGIIRVASLEILSSGGSNQDRHKPGCTATVLRFLEMDLGSREIVLCNQKARVKFRGGSRLFGEGVQIYKGGSFS